MLVTRITSVNSYCADTSPEALLAIAQAGQAMIQLQAKIEEIESAQEVIQDRELVNTIDGGNTDA